MSAPHWPEFAHVGLGDAAAPPGISFDAQGQIQLPNPAQIVAYLPPGFLALGNQAIGAVQTAMGAIQGAAPALGLIGAIAGGGAPDPQMAIGALSATVALINPVAGAVVGAAGELALVLENAAQSLFQSLGLISPPPVTYPFHGGIKRGDPVPWGRGHSIWKPWSYFTAPYLTNPNGIPYEYMWQHILSQEDAASATTNFYMTSLLGACNRYGETPGAVGPNGKNDFERFFYSMLRPDFENWWNASPAIPPRDLLMGAVSLWNATHASVQPTFTTQQIFWFAPTQVQTGGDVTYSSAGATQGGAGDPIAWLLSQWGDASGVGREAPPITVHMGAFLTHPQTVALHLHAAPAPVTAPAPATSMSTGAKVAVSGAAIGGAALLGTAAYAVAKGEAVDVVLGHAWKHMKGWFHK
jgi:hypothetical protein